MTKLTKRQNEILSLIQSHMSATGSPPTRAEIAKIMGFKSPNAAEDHLRALARKGVIELVPGTSRGIRLTRFGVPIISQKIGKQALLSEDNILGYSRVEKKLFEPELDFLVQINTNEFQSLNIISGDYLAIHQTDTAQESQLVLIRNAQELSIKPYSSALVAQNLSMEGKVVGLIRSFSSSLL